MKIKPLLNGEIDLQHDSTKLCVHGNSYEANGSVSS